ncbi:metal ABC transporter substrate-binding protein [Paenibacillus crassostreae]|uniref:Zinc ABC transporter substrate-binding protein n=1 Tax=Paenibacillus crassostreae TaxID=1763538 RepID=A0A167FHD2_9BACL|nr:metal ABC transporter substrate-binding protein [Paenibacillus crassostreae]AOZ94400.1 zinc ABC transporter substrate-binding protein [Paenibacillus crassostreae]OAB76563.1 zinc ABC transporter substrate-binding protein [Paenibacillus crassostreae]
MKSYYKISLVFVALAAILVTGCGKNNVVSTNASNNASTSEGTVQSEQKLKVVTSFYPMYEFSKQVAGDHAEVVVLVPTGTEPHDWEPSAKDMALVSDADIFVYNGIVEEWADKALESASNDKRIVVEASHGIDLMEGEAHDHGDGEEAHEHEEGEVHADEEAHDHEEGEVHTHEEAHEHEHILDPHVWLSPVLAQKQVTAILDAFVKADPANEEDYRKNAEAYIAQLQQLDEEFEAGLKDIKSKEFVTQHAAFGYLAKEYGLTQVAIAGLSPEEEPSPDKMVDIVKFAKEHNVTTIFFETLADPKVADTIAKEMGVRTDVLNPIEGLTKDETDEQMDYISVMKKNLEGLIIALNG